MAALDGALVVLASSYTWLADHVWTGMASIWLAMLVVSLGLVCTVVGGLRIRRLYVGAFGILPFWIAITLADVATSSASLQDAATYSLMPYAFQLLVLAFVSWAK